jgi:hypothetical protein
MDLSALIAQAQELEADKSGKLYLGPTVSASYRAELELEPRTDAIGAELGAVNGYRTSKLWPTVADGATVAAGLETRAARPVESQALTNRKRALTELAITLQGEREAAAAAAGNGGTDGSDA